jgi:hypothetical protein
LSRLSLPIAYDQLQIRPDTGDILQDVFRVGTIKNADPVSVTSCTPPYFSRVVS